MDEKILEIFGVIQELHAIFFICAKAWVKEYRKEIA
jgi:hypothetical protein